MNCTVYCENILQMKYKWCK